jgi:hypothetical protein
MTHPTLVKMTTHSPASPLHRNGREHSIESTSAPPPKHLNPYTTIGGSLLAGATIGYFGAAMRPGPKIKHPENRTRVLDHDGFHYREVLLDGESKVGLLERTAVGTDIKPHVREVNPDIKIQFDVVREDGDTVNHLPKQIDVVLPMNKTFKYVTEAAPEKAKNPSTNADAKAKKETEAKKTKQQEARLTGKVEARYVNPEFQNVTERDFRPGLTELDYYDEGKQALQAKVDAANQKVVYTDYHLATPGTPPETTTLDISTLGKESPHLFLDLRKTLKSNLPAEELEPDPKTGLAKADRYKRISTMPVGSNQYTWHPTAVEKLETEFNKAMLAYNGFSSLEEVQAHTRLNFRTQGGIVGGILGLAAGLSVWSYSKWRIHQAEKKR